ELIGEIYTKSTRLVSGYPCNGRLLPCKHRVVDRQRRQLVSQIGDHKIRPPLACDNSRFQVPDIVRRQRLTVIGLVLDGADERAREMGGGRVVVVDGLQEVE